MDAVESGCALLDGPPQWLQPRAGQQVGEALARLGSRVGAALAQRAQKIASGDDTEHRADGRRIAVGRLDNGQPAGGRRGQRALHLGKGRVRSHRVHL